MQATEALLSRTPGGAGVMARRAEAQSRELGANVERVASNLTPISSGEQAGRAINRGVQDFVQYVHQADNQLYGIVDQQIPPATPVGIPRTQRYLQQVTAPVQGAPNTSQLLANNRLGQINEALGADLQAAQNGQLPYQAVRALRTRVGEAIQNNALVNDVPTSQLRRLYGVLSQDLQAAAQQAGPDAARAAIRANSFHRAAMRRLEIVENVVDRNGGPEAIFRAATAGTAEGASTLRAVMQSLPEDGQRMVAATTLRRLGRATPGTQNEIGDRFSTETFLTNWNRLSPQAKRALFDRFGPQMRNDIDQIARVADNLRQGSQVFRNPSGTAQATAQGATAGAFVLSALTGNFGTAGAIAGGVATTNIVARALTNPAVVRWIARATRAPVSALPALLTQAAQSNDQDLQELAEALRADHDAGR